VAWLLGCHPVSTAMLRIIWLYACFPCTMSFLTPDFAKIIYELNRFNRPKIGRKISQKSPKLA
jgi:hypothetical protein